MQIHQAATTKKNQTDPAIAFLCGFAETVKANGFVADALARPGQDATITRHPERPLLRTHT